MLRSLADTEKKKIRFNFSEPESLLKWKNVHTVCEESGCPNRLECSRLKTATFMIGGKYCTRNCKFCKVEHGRPLPLSSICGPEKHEILQAVKVLDLKYAVITSVTRDDEEESLALHFADICRELKNRQVKVELLIPDFSVNHDQLRIIGNANPDVLAHNIETVPGITDKIRSKATYEKSLKVLQFYRDYYPKIYIKTGLMVGFGESMSDLEEVFMDLAKTGIDMLTIGQYLRPGENQIEVTRFYSPEEFEKIKNTALECGIGHVEAGFYTRSSYRAKTMHDSIGHEGNKWQPN